MMRKQIERRLRKRLRASGQAVVEMAPILPLFLLIRVGILDFGRVFYSYERIQNAAREGAAWLALRPTASTTAVQNRVQSEGVDCSDGPVTAPTNGAYLIDNLGNRATTVSTAVAAVVTVEYRFELVTPFLQRILSDTTPCSWILITYQDDAARSLCSKILAEKATWAVRGDFTPCASPMLVCMIALRGDRIRHLARSSGLRNLRGFAIASLAGRREVIPNKRSILSKRSTLTRLALLFVLLSVLGGLVVACAAPKAAMTPTAVPTPALDASGQPILKPVGAVAKPSEFAGWGVTISKVGRAKTISKAGLVALEAKGVWLILHLTVSNGGKAAASFPRQSLAAKDATGNEYKLDATTSDHYSFGAKLSNQGAAVAPKGTLEVGAVFDINPAAVGLKLKVGTQEIAIQE